MYFTNVLHVGLVAHIMSCDAIVILKVNGFSLSGLVWFSLNTTDLSNSLMFDCISSIQTLQPVVLWPVIGKQGSGLKVQEKSRVTKEIPNMKMCHQMTYIRANVCVNNIC